MENQQHLQGHAIVQTDQDGREIAVFYTVLTERHAAVDGPEELTISGRVGVDEDPWLETLLIKHGRILILEDDRRLEIRVRASGRGSTTLSFLARPLDATEFAR